MTSTRTPQKIWDENEISILKELYPTTDISVIANKLNRTIGSVHKKSRKLKLRKEYFNYHNYDQIVNNLTNVTLPEAAYFLGYIWADGYVEHGQVRLAIKQIDGEAIMPIIKKLGDLCINYSDYNKRNFGQSSMIKFNICNVNFCKYLLDNDFGIKSIATPTKILSKIPNHLHKFFYLGWCDGDGCFYISEKNKKFTLAAAYDTDYNKFENLLTSLNIKYKIYREINKINQKRSILEIRKLIYIFKFGNFLYSTFLNDNIGLYRKYEKYLLIKDKVVNNRYSSIRNSNEI